MGLVICKLEPGRHGVSPRHVARAGEVWRLLQTLAPEASGVGGWHPRRYVEENCGFVVAAMAVRHHGELPSTVAVEGRTWVSQVLRGTLFRRELGLYDADGRPLVEATQDWVHVKRGPEGGWKPGRAAPSLIEAFALRSPGPLVVEPLPAPPRATAPWEFAVWHGWMDPQAHVNHPTYVDWCDEALAREEAAAGRDPQGLVPVSEHLRWKGAFVGGEAVSLSTEVEGEVSHHAIRSGEELRVSARLVRRRLG
jgi:acyl-CoA thioesterase FadM